tara:strand:+ start:313 stop:492 length:180 start_codon:yes stop_codon:yes gene_type:complete
MDLNEDEITWIRSQIAQEKAMSALGKRVRSVITFAMLLIGGSVLLWDNFKIVIKNAVSP